MIRVEFLEIFCLILRYDMISLIHSHTVTVPQIQIPGTFVGDGVIWSLSRLALCRQIERQSMKPLHITRREGSRLWMVQRNRYITSGWAVCY